MVMTREISSYLWWYLLSNDVSDFCALYSLVSNTSCPKWQVYTSGFPIPLNNTKYGGLAFASIYGVCLFNVKSVGGLR